MSHNPARLEQPHHRHRQPELTDGIRHSDIMKRHGGGAGMPSMAMREKTRHGVGVTLFEGAFVVRHEVMFSGNSIGFGVHETGDRLVRVQKGSMFVIVEDDGERKIRPLSEGGYFQAARGLRYGFATSGVDGVELLIVETPDYDKGWTQLEEPTVGTATMPMAAPAAEVMGSTRARDLDAATHAQAEEMAAQQGRRRTPSASTAAAAQPNANSTNSIGVNPRPSGPPREE